MSTRTYFQRRDIIPGITYLLIILLYFPEFIISLYNNPNTLNFLEITITLFFSGSTLGFLISNIWWYHFQRTKTHYYLAPHSTATLLKKYKLRNIEKNVIAVFGYVAHYEIAKEGMKEIGLYTTRRWDLYHLLQSTITSIKLANMTGIGSRIVLAILWPDSYLPVTVLEILYFLGIPSIFFINAIIMKFSSNWIMYHYDIISNALFRRTELTENEIRDAFPECFFIDPRTQAENDLLQNQTRNAHS